MNTDLISILFFISIILFGISYGIAKRYAHQISKKRPPNKNIRILVFDLHDVLMHKNKGAMIYRSLMLACKPSMITTIINPFLWRDCLVWLYKKTVFEEFLQTMTQKYPGLHPYEQTILDITNAQKPCTPLLQALKIYKDKGYSLYIFSNIGEQSFAQLQESFPGIFVDFDGIMVAQHHDKWIQKPQPLAYQKFITQFGINPEECLFVDNSIHNIKAALEAHFEAIHYRSADQLLNELNARLHPQ